MTNIKVVEMFGKLKEKTLVGSDGDIEVFVEKDNYLLFVRDRKNLNEECFIIAEETLLNKNDLNDSREET